MKKFSSFNSQFSTKKGFTLIELLIVIAIIGVLSALLTANFIGVRQRARDGQRKSDLRQIQSALELYRADEGSYPPASGNTLPANCSTSFGNRACSVIYMRKIPSEPLGTPSYTYSTSGITYSLVACLENGNDPEIDATDTCGALSRWSFTLYNP